MPALQGSNDQLNLFHVHWMTGGPYDEGRLHQRRNCSLEVGNMACYLFASLHRTLTTLG
jgi:hypothetical protein